MNLNWQRDRLGTVLSPELPTRIEVATPPEFEGGIPGIWSPEHLYTAAVLSCYMTTFLAIAEHSKLIFSAFDCKAEGVLEKTEGKYLMTEIMLYPVLKLTNESQKERAQRVLEKAETACLISNSIKTVVRLKTSIEVDAE